MLGMPDTKMEGTVLITVTGAGRKFHPWWWWWWWWWWWCIF